MSDLVNALNEASGGGSLPKPVVVNPLAAMGGAAQTATAIYGVREKQAEQAIGQILQQSTDANGNVDYQKAHSLAASAGPIVQMGMQRMLLNSSILRGQQLDQAQKHMSNIGAAALTLVNDPSDANLEMVRQNLISSGYPADAISKEIAAAQQMGPDQRKQWAYQHGLAAMEPGAALGRTTGQTTVTQFGGTSAPTTVTQPGPYTQPGVSVGPGIAHTVSPETYYNPKESSVWLDANGNVTTDPTKVARVVTKAIPQGAPMGAPAPGTVSGPPGAPSAPAPGGAGGLPPGAPAPPGGTKLVGGRFQTAPAPGGAPAAPTAAPAAPAAPTSAPAPRAPPAPAAAPGIVTAPPQGQPAEQEASQKQFIADRTALPQRQTLEQNLNHAYEALRLVTSGRGTESASNLRNFLATVGLLPAGKVDDEALYEIARKYTERTIAEAGNAGGTDTARALAAASSPNVSLINPANLTFLRNDIGKVRQQMAAYMTAPDTTIGQGYGAHSANIASNTDYRGFNWDMYSPAEQKEIEKSVGKQGSAAHDALARAIGMGHALWPQKGAGPLVAH